MQHRRVYVPFCQKGASFSMKPFQPDCHALLIGSLPVDDHQQALEMVFRYTPHIPLWVQLPSYREEGMMLQFLPGMPGLVMDSDSVCVDTTKPDFDHQVLTFYEHYLAVSEGTSDIFDSPFGLTPQTAKGFFVLLDRLRQKADSIAAVKGQVTGPVTFTTGISDSRSRAIFYDDQLRDLAVKLLSLKARYQANVLSAFGAPVIIFLDEPALAGFGSSVFISISREEVLQCLDEVIGAIHEEGGLAGIHVCANADWSVVLDSSADIISFDSYAFFDTFVLYAREVKRFFDQGKTLAWGIVPTSSSEDIQRETSETLRVMWEGQATKLERLGVSQERLIQQSLITPACGTGSMSLEDALKVLELTSKLSDSLRTAIL
jgi:methionine synthase II (cobalamin-independent)